MQGWLESIDFSRYDIVLADVRWHEGTLKSFELARAAGVPTLLDADMTPQDITHWWRLPIMPFFNSRSEENDRAR